MLAVFTSKYTTMYIPISSILKIDGYVLMLEPNCPDYRIVRDGVEELAPCVPAISISRTIITFEQSVPFNLKAKS